MFKDVYTALKQRLNTELDWKNELDWYLHQYDQDGEEVIYTTPAVFVEFVTVEWNTYPDNRQRGVMEFRIHLVNECNYDTDQRILDATLNHLGQESEVFRALMGWGCKLSYITAYAALNGTDNDAVLINDIIRTRTDPDHELSNLLVSVQTFQANVYDYNALPQWQSIVATLNLQAALAEHITDPFTP